MTRGLRSQFALWLESVRSRALGPKPATYEDLGTAMGFKHNQRPMAHRLSKGGYLPPPCTAKAILRALGTHLSKSIGMQETHLIVHRGLTALANSYIQQISASATCYVLTPKTPKPVLLQAITSLAPAIRELAREMDLPSSRAIEEFLRHLQFKTPISLVSAADTDYEIPPSPDSIEGVFESFYEALVFRLSEAKKVQYRGQDSCTHKWRKKDRSLTVHLPDPKSARNMLKLFYAGLAKRSLVYTIEIPSYQRIIPRITKECSLAKNKRTQTYSTPRAFEKRLKEIYKQLIDLMEL